MGLRKRPSCDKLSRLEMKLNRPPFQLFYFPPPPRPFHASHNLPPHPFYPPPHHHSPYETEYSFSFENTSLSNFIDFPWPTLLIYTLKWRDYTIILFTYKNTGCFPIFDPFQHPRRKHDVLADGVDQDQTAQNVQSDLRFKQFTCVVKPPWYKTFTVSMGLNFQPFKPFLHKPWILRVSSTSLLKTLWEKE